MHRFQVSVCIPTYNRRSLLLNTLASLERQSVGLDDFEVILADDGSTDGTDQAIRHRASQYALRYVRLDHQGSGAARNAAARLARAKLLVFLDDDQLASTDLLAAHLKAQSVAGEALVQGDYPLARSSRVAGTSMLYERSREHHRQGSAGARDFIHLWGANVSVPWRVWAAVGGFDETLLRNQDLDFGLRVRALGIPIVFVPEALSYHVHASNAAAFRRQHFMEGQSMVQLARKHEMSVAAVLGGRADHRLDRAVQLSWRSSGSVTNEIGHWLSGLLWLTDRVGWKAGQVMAARLVRRFYLIGGITTEMAGQALPPGGIEPPFRP